MFNLFNQSKIKSKYVGVNFEKPKGIFEKPRGLYEGYNTVFGF